MKPFADPHHDKSPFYKGFSFIMNHLKPKLHHNSIRLLVPDTVFFHHGETKFLVYNKKDREYNYIKESHKLTNNVLKEFFKERKRKNEQDIELYYPELLIAKRKMLMEFAILKFQQKKQLIPMIPTRRRASS